MISGEEQRADPECADVVDTWGEGVERFDPQTVLAMTSIRDLEDLKQDGWPAYEAPGSPGHDELVLETYIRVTDLLGSGGAEVVWLLPPCVRFVDFFGNGSDTPAVFEPERMRHVREVILPRLVEARPSVRLLDLGAELCPGGRFLETVAGVGALRPDGLHLTAEASEWLAERLAPLVFDAP